MRNPSVLCTHSCGIIRMKRYVPMLSATTYHLRSPVLYVALVLGRTDFKKFFLGFCKCRWNAEIFLFARRYGQFATPAISINYGVLLWSTGILLLLELALISALLPQLFYFLFFFFVVVVKRYNASTKIVTQLGCRHFASHTQCIVWIRKLFLRYIYPIYVQPNQTFQIFPIWN